VIEVSFFGVDNVIEVWYSEWELLTTYASSDAPDQCLPLIICQRRSKGSKDKSNNACTFQIRFVDILRLKFQKQNVYMVSQL